MGEIKTLLHDGKLKFTEPTPEMKDYESQRVKFYKQAALFRTSDADNYTYNKKQKIEALLVEATTCFKAMYELLLDYGACCAVQEYKKKKQEAKEDGKKKRLQANLVHEAAKKKARQEEERLLNDIDLFKTPNADQEDKEEDEELGKQQLQIQLLQQQIELLLLKQKQRRKKTGKKTTQKNTRTKTTKTTRT